MINNEYCYLCSSKSRVELFAQKGIDPYLSLIDEGLHEVHRAWYVCDDCGFVYRSPVLDENELATLYASYEKNIFEGTTPDEYFEKIVSLPHSESENYQKAHWLYQEIKKHTASKGSPLKILDVGCGGGTLLYTLSQIIETVELFGIERNLAYAELAQRRSQATVINEEFKPGLFGQKFNLIVLTKVLEHVPSPKNFLQALVQDLLPNGMLFVEVPDTMDFKKLPSSHQSFFIPHIYYFSQNTLSALICGLECNIVAKRTIRTLRDRNYLQVLAQRSNKNSRLLKKPYDNPENIIEMVQQGFSNQSKFNVK